MASSKLPPTLPFFSPSLRVRPASLSDSSPSLFWLFPHFFSHTILLIKSLHVYSHLDICFLQDLDQYNQHTTLNWLFPLFSSLLNNSLLFPLTADSCFTEIMQGIRWGLNPPAPPSIPICREEVSFLLPKPSLFRGIQDLTLSSPGRSSLL